LEQLLKNNYDKQIKMHIFKKVMKLAIENTNQIFTATPLFSLWDRLKFQRPVPPYMPFVRKDRKNKHSLHHFWKTHQINERGTRSIFHSRDRIKLTYSLIQSQINLDKLERYRLIEAHFPLHDYWDFEGREVIGVSSSFQYLQDQRLYTRIINILSQEKDRVLGLKNCWSKKLFRLDLPIYYIRSYFGEKIALYFSFLGFYTKWLIFATILGTITGVARWFVRIHDDFYDEVSAFYCIGIMIWATLFIEFWKREQAILAIEWGQTDFEQEEAVRPGFKGKLIRSPIDDNPNELYYSNQSRFKRLLISTGISFGLKFIVILIVSIILTHQTRLEEYKAQYNFLIIFGQDFSPDLASVLIGIQILIFNQIYKKISYYLVEFENWRTQSEFENSMIMKRFTFEFVNAYISMFYIAFFKTYIEGCDIVTPHGVTPNVIGGDCLSELTNELGTVYLIIFSENLLRMLYDKYKKRYIKEYTTNPRIHAQVFDIESLRSDLDAQMKCKSYHSEGAVDGTYEDFQELIVQYGFVTLFAVAFPIAPMLTLMTNFLEMFLDRDKLLNKMRRPLPQGAKNIGKWFDVLNIITGIAILTNSGILCFTIHAFVDWPIFAGNPFVPFMLMLGGLYWLRKVVSESVPEIPRNYQLVIKRHNCVIDRTLRGKKPIKKRTDGKMEYLDTSIKGVKRY
jgi:anoctamin-10